MPETPEITEALWETALPGLPPPRRGKARDVYDLGETLLIVATDRRAAYDQGGGGARRERRLRGARAGRARGGAGARRAPARSDPRPLRSGGLPRRPVRPDPRRHQVRVRPDRRRAPPGRRGPHPRLLALLGRRPLAAGHRAGLLRQAVRQELARRLRLGPPEPAAP